MSEAGRISGKRASSLLASRIVSPVVTLLIYALLGRFGERGELGLYYYAYNFVTVFQILANFGYDAYLTREVARNPKRAPAMLANSLLVLVPYGVCLSLAMPAAASAAGFDQAVTKPLLVGASCLLPMVLAYALEAFLIGAERFRPVLAASTLDGALRLLLSIVAIRAGYGTAGLLLALAAGRLVAVVVEFSALMLCTGISFAETGRGPLAKLIRGATPFFLMYAAYAVAGRLDGVLLARFASPHEGDYYSIPNRLALSVWLLSGSIVGSLYPAMSRAAGSPKLGRMVVGLERRFLLAILPAALLLSAYAELPLALISGWDYAKEAAPVMRILALTMVPMAMNEPALKGLLAAGGQRSCVKISLLVLLVSGVTMTLAVRAFGAIGAACALPFVSVTDLSLNLAVLSRRSSLSGLFRRLLPIFFAGGIAYLVHDLCHPSLGFVAAPLFLVVYLAILLMTGSISPDELRDPRRLLAL